MLKLVRFLLLTLGVGLAVLLIRPHLQDIGAALVRVSWGFTWFMAASFLIYALDSWAWRLTFAREQPHVGFCRLFSVRMAGEAVNKITPLASMGGEPLKAYLLARRGAGAADALASVAVAKNTMTLAQIAFIFTGIALAFGVQLQGTGAALGFGAFPGLILGAILVTAVADLRLRRQRGRRMAAAGPLESRKGRRREAIADLWGRVADFFWANPRAFGASFALFFLGWAAGALELIAAARVLGFPLSVRDALAMEALLVSINMATFFIPANAGSQEGGFVYLAQMFGLSNPQGLTLAVLRRCRDFIWIAFGLAYLALVEGRILFRPRREAETEPPVPAASAAVGKE